MPGSTRFALVASLAVAASLAGCGGGGGGGDDAPAQAQRVDITMTNAPAVTAQAVDAASGDFFDDAVGVAGADANAAAVRGRMFAQALGGAVHRAHGASKRPLLEASDTFPCTFGGEVEITVAVAVQGEVAVGDLATLDFSACREGLVVLDGRLALRFVSVSADQTRVTADATATALTARIGRIGQRADGTIRIAIDESSATRSVVRVTSDAFSFRRLVGSTVRATRTLYDYDYRLETTIAGGQTSETFAYVASGSFPVLGEVSFAVESTAPVVTPGGAEHPTSGAATVTGRNGTTLDLEVVPTGVVWELDRGGNGSVEATGTITWVGIEGEL